MAKEMTAADIAAWLESKGFSIPEDVAAARDNAVEDAAYAKVSEKMVRDDDENADHYNERVTTMQEILFDLSETMAAQVSGDQRNVGRGTKFVRVLEVDTHEGTLTVTLRS